VPNSNGGLYAYARHEFGDFVGYLTGWSYWVSSWPGNAAIAVSWVFYVNALFGIGHPTAWSNLGIALLGIWVPAAINLAHLQHLAWIQNLTVVLKFLPLLFVGVVGWFFVSRANFGPFNASGGSLYDAIGLAAGVALFAYIGVESAAITAQRVKDPARNVGRASVLGTGGCAILYLLVTGAVMGLVPHHALVGNGAPFVNAFDMMFPHGTWAGKLIAAVAVTSGFGALIGWTLVDAELPRAVANDGLFPKPLGWSDRNGNAWLAIVINAAFPSLLMLWRYTTSSGLTVFTYMVNLTVVTVAIPYFFSACAQLTYLVSKRRRVQGWALARDLTVAGAGALFSMWVNFAAGYQAVYQTLVAVFVGIIVYVFLNARREDAGQIPEPVDSPQLPDAHEGA
jgi:basic amino acid/polyamine antiporter, APA family